MFKFYIKEYLIHTTWYPSVSSGGRHIVWLSLA
jgi:hypothetical protein